MTMTACLQISWTLWDPGLPCLEESAASDGWCCSRMFNQDPPRNVPWCRTTSYIIMHWFLQLQNRRRKETSIPTSPWLSWQWNWICSRSTAQVHVSQQRNGILLGGAEQVFWRGIDVCFWFSLYRVVCCFWKRGCSFKAEHGTIF